MGVGMNDPTKRGVFGVAAALAATAIWSGGMAQAQDAAARGQLSAQLITTYQPSAVIPSGVIEGVVAGTPIVGLPGAIWADRDNDGHVDGFIRNGEYFPGTPPGYNRALRRVVIAVDGVARDGATSVISRDVVDRPSEKGQLLKIKGKLREIQAELN